MVAMMVNYRTQKADTKTDCWLMTQRKFTEITENTHFDILADIAENTQIHNLADVAVLAQHMPPFLLLLMQP